MNQDKTTLSFAEGSISRTVFANTVPAIAAMLMVLVYNLADTFFIGQTHNDYMVAAVSLATPIFLIFMAVGTLFGMGGTSVISRAYGEGRREYAKKVSAFCMWACIVVGLVLMTFLWVFMDVILAWLGASKETLDYTRTYLNIVAVCGVFSLIANCYSNIIRAEGKPAVAMGGTLIGNLLNVILDPVMILGLGWGMAGAAIATVVGNVVAAMFYLFYFWSGKSGLSIRIKDFSMKEGICVNVLAIGVPASLGSLLMSLSQMIANSLMAGYGDMSIAAYGVSAKVLMIVTLFAIGLGQGIQPVLGYCYGARNHQRFRDVLKFSLWFSLILSGTTSLLCFLFTGPIVQMFLTDSRAMGFGVRFSRIMLVTAWLFGVYYVLINALQAMGAAKPSFILSVCRQGVIYIPAVFLMNIWIGREGVVWAQPVADICSLVLAMLFLKKELDKMNLIQMPERL